MYDTIPVIFVRNAGGGQSIEQFIDAIDGFNSRIVALLQDKFPQCEPERFKLYGIKHTGASPDIDPEVFRKGRAQVLFRLTNTLNIKTYVVEGRDLGRKPRVGDLVAAKKLYSELHEQGRLWHKKPLSGGKLRVTLLFDEGDSTIQSAGKMKAKTEWALYANECVELDSEFVGYLKFVLVEAVHYVVHITATPTALFFTAADTRFNAIIMPMKKNYYGFASALAGTDRQICVRSADTAGALPCVCITVEGTPMSSKHAEAEEYIVAHPGIETMVKDMLADRSGVQRVGLINAETLIPKQNVLQDVLLNNLCASGRPVITLTHNGGNGESKVHTKEGDFKYACRLRVSDGVPLEILRKFAQPASETAAKLVAPKGDDLEAGVAVFPWALITKRRYENKVVTKVDESCRTVYFRRCVDVGDILDMIHRASVELSATGGQPLVFIIAGRMGGRGITYKSRNRVMHLTDEYLHLNTKSTHAQCVGRCFARATSRRMLTTLSLPLPSSHLDSPSSSLRASAASTTTRRSRGCGARCPRGPCSTACSSSRTRSCASQRRRTPAARPSTRRWRTLTSASTSMCPQARRFARLRRP